jgi:hypothetical protein
VVETRSSIQLCSTLTPQSLAQLGIVRVSAIDLRCAARVLPAARSEFPPSRGRASAGWGLLCAESQSIDPADRSNARRTTLQSHGCPANHHYIAPCLDTCTTLAACAVVTLCLVAIRLPPQAAGMQSQAERSRSDTLVLWRYSNGETQTSHFNTKRG